jgi:hypothetical protein
MLHVVRFMLSVTCGMLPVVCFMLPGGGGLQAVLEERLRQFARRFHASHQRAPNCEVSVNTRMHNKHAHSRATRAPNGELRTRTSGVWTQAIGLRRIGTAHPPLHSPIRLRPLRACNEPTQSHLRCTFRRFVSARRLTCRRLVPARTNGSTAPSRARSRRRLLGSSRPCVCRTRLRRRRTASPKCTSRRTS